METKIFQPDQIADAARLIQDGQLVAFPTETVYGLGADATNPQAVGQVYQAKGRPSDNPLIVHVSSPAMVAQYAAVIPEKAQQLMDQFWPGSLTIILPIKSGALDPVVTGGLDTVAFRLPDNQVTIDLINQAGVPIVGPSANTSGKPSPTTAQHVYHDLKGKIAGIVDDGPTRVGLESTVIDLWTDHPAILRPGVVTKAAIEAVIGSLTVDHHQVKDNETPKAPGMKYKHYAPNAQVLMVNDDDWDQVKDQLVVGSTGVLATDEHLNQLNLDQSIPTFSLGNDVQSASTHLFAGLRWFDDQPAITTIYAQTFPNQGVGEAYMNRLNKSAGGQFFHGMAK